MTIDNKITVSLNDVTVTFLSALLGMKFSAQEAFDTTRALLYGEIRGGKRNHGLDRFPWIKKNLGKSFKIGGQVAPAFYPNRNDIVILQSDGGCGYSHIYEAVLCAIELSKRVPSVTVALRDAYPSNCLGDYAGLLGEAGLVSYVGSLSPARVAMPGARAPKLPTSGQAFGFPGTPPFVLDFSIGAVTNGDLVRCRREGKPLPAGTCLDVDGQPTTDASRVVDVDGKIIGAILPRGGDESYLMAGLGIVMLMTAVETGLKMDHKGTFMVARRPPVEIASEFDALRENLVQGLGQARLPGSGSEATARTVLGRGELELDIPLWRDIEAAGATKLNHALNLNEIASKILNQLTKGFYEPFDLTIAKKYQAFASCPN